MPGFTDRKVCRFPAQSSGIDNLAIEEPLEFRIQGEPLLITMRTPGHDVELAAGFCLTEGIIEHADELDHVESCSLANYGNVVLITLSESAYLQFRHKASARKREFFMSSSCGICGSQTIEHLSRNYPKATTHFTVSEQVLHQLPSQMCLEQESFVRTGGIHAAAYFTTEGVLCHLREDVGRHNAVDKVIGALLLNGQLPAPPGIMLVSGRTSYEVAQKCLSAGISFLASIGAPSSLAYDIACQTGMTLVGFLRDGRFNVYYDCGRIRAGNQHPQPVIEHPFQ